MRLALEQHERIKMRLRIAGSSLAEVARELDVAGTTVTSVSQGYRRSRRIETAIAVKLGVSPADLWPDRYPGGSDGDVGPALTRPLDCLGGGVPRVVFC
ncbi:helix-turn-helix domain-containing protein [Sinimarinibacterium sp. CAU 1509]|uniref:helix-turn-helix domain-containing protein n=1 Tax=Sinimarinibacterium sp. CAU 1509 TaxID=2562283 RepID=UPI001B7FBE77|nr:helix-turn-helix domain-containing protein [Sinimarinibacterium sp. CAU 1509]